ncbi:hypothetical protein TNCV_4375771 [Trichonephila clavipes]|uniref:Uncharacterized protein n=1 Tax=Trichonephila clavipes TaxID=2585209 RepID=A0A8X6W2Y3_TRICX|nr:hypothetical protein TNCV_4375771 [Trichonephila clavipes]
MTSFLVLCEGNTRNRWRDGQVCPDVDKELWRLGPDGSSVFWRVMRKSDEGENGGKKKVGRGGRRDPGERTDGRSEEEEKETGERERTEGEDGRRDGWRKGLSPEIGVKKTMNAGGVEKGI